MIRHLGWWLLGIAFPFVLGGCGKSYDPDEILAGFLSKDDAKHAQARADLLAHGDEMTESLISVLRDEKHRDRHGEVVDLFHQALQSGRLKEFKLNKVAGVLGDVLRGRETPPDLRRRVAGILKDFKVKTAVRPLIAVLGSGDNDLERTAIDSLTAIGDLAVPLLVAERDDPETPEGRKAAVLLALDRQTESLGDRLRSEDQAKRLEAVKSLGTINSPSARAAAHRLMKDSSADVRVAVVKVLGVRPDDSEREALLQATLDANSKVAIQACCALADAGDPRSHEGLLKGLGASDTEEQIRAIEGLKALKREGSSPAVAALLSAKDVKVRRAAALALESLGGAGAQEPLLQAMGKDDQDLQVTLSCAKVLGRMGVPEAVTKLTGLLHLNDNSVRVPAIDALGAIGVPALEKLHEAIRDVSLARQAGVCAALGRIASKESVPHLVEVLGRPEPEAGTGEPEKKDPKELAANIGDVRVAAILALAQIGDERAVEPVCRQLAAKEARVRWFAEWSLSTLGEKAGRAAAQQLDTGEATPASIRAAARVGDASAVEAMGDRIPKMDLGLQVEATRALSRLALRGVKIPPAPLRLIQDMARKELADFDDPDAGLQVRLASLETLGLAGDKSSLPVLIDVLVSENHPELRMAVIAAVGQILRGPSAKDKSPLSEAELLTLLIEQDDQLMADVENVEKVRRQALLRIGELGQLRGLSAVVKVLSAESESEPLRHAASFAYLKITGNPFEGALEKP